jgi:hypothetical protein
MAERSTPIGWIFVKFLVVPAGMLVAGYLFLGPFVPRVLGATGKLKAFDPEPELKAEETKRTFTEPEVQVSVEKATGPRLRSYRPNIEERPRRRRSEPKREEKTEEPAPTVEPPVSEPADPTTGGDGGIGIA